MTTLYIAAEQGCGDALSFLRFIPAAAARVDRIILSIHPELTRLAGLMLHPILGDRLEVRPIPGPFPVADAWCPLGSLPTALGLTTEQIRDAPGIPVPEWDRPPAPWRQPGAKLHVGVAWAGSPDNDIDRWRSFAPEHFLELFRVPGVALYSIQVGPKAADLHAIGAAGLIRDLAPYIRDACDTVALMRDLDLVVAAESFPRHIAGCLQKECWVPMSRLGGDWRIGREGERVLWDPATRLFRQGVDNAWGPVFQRIVEALGEKVDA